MRHASLFSPLDLGRHRLSHRVVTAPYNRATFVGGDAAGYTDYPVHGGPSWT